MMYLYNKIEGLITDSTSKRKMGKPGDGPTSAIGIASEKPVITYSLSQRVFGVLFYAASSFLIMMVNKIALYVWKFPSVATLALAQFVFSVISLRLLKAFGVISFPDPSRASLRAVFPLPILFVGNAISGLHGTKTLSLPMFTVLRRTNMLFTMILEYWLLGTSYSYNVKLSIALMMVGSMVATLLDMQFDFLGYSATLLNNVFTSVGGVITKLKLNASENVDDRAALTSMWGLMYMNSLVGTPLLFGILVICYPETLVDAYNFEDWDDPIFVIMFLLSAAMGTILQLSIFYCTKVNSALTTVVTGVLKNVLTSYAGMLDIRLGYTFNWLNFIGINLSMFGGIWYAYLQFVESSTKSNSKSALNVVNQDIKKQVGLGNGHDKDDNDDEEAIKPLRSPKNNIVK